MDGLVSMSAVDVYVSGWFFFAICFSQLLTQSLLSRLIPGYQNFSRVRCNQNDNKLYVAKRDLFHEHWSHNCDVLFLVVFL